MLDPSTTLQQPDWFAHAHGAMDDAGGSAATGGGEEPLSVRRHSLQATTSSFSLDPSLHGEATLLLPALSSAQLDAASIRWSSTRSSAGAEPASGPSTLPLLAHPLLHVTDSTQQQQQQQLHTRTLQDTQQPSQQKLSHALLGALNPLESVLWQQRQHQRALLDRALHALTSLQADVDKLLTVTQRKQAQHQLQPDAGSSLSLLLDTSGRQLQSLAGIQQQKPPSAEGIALQTVPSDLLQLEGWQQQQQQLQEQERPQQQHQLEILQMAPGTAARAHGKRSPEADDLLLPGPISASIPGYWAGQAGSSWQLAASGPVAATSTPAPAAAAELLTAVLLEDHQNHDRNYQMAAATPAATNDSAARNAEALDLSLNDFEAELLQAEAAAPGRRLSAEALRLYAANVPGWYHTSTADAPASSCTSSSKNGSCTNISSRAFGGSASDIVDAGRGPTPAAAALPASAAVDVCMPGMQASSLLAAMDSFEQQLLALEAAAPGRRQSSTAADVDDQWLGHAAAAAADPAAASEAAATVATISADAVESSTSSGSSNKMVHDEFSAAQSPSAAAHCTGLVGETHVLSNQACNNSSGTALSSNSGSGSGCGCGSRSIVQSGIAPELEAAVLAGSTDPAAWTASCSPGGCVQQVDCCAAGNECCKLADKMLSQQISSQRVAFQLLLEEQDQDCNMLEQQQSLQQQQQHPPTVLQHPAGGQQPLVAASAAIARGVEVLELISGDDRSSIPGTISRDSSPADLDTFNSNSDTDAAAAETAQVRPADAEGESIAAEHVLHGSAAAEGAGNSSSGTNYKAAKHASDRDDENVSQAAQPHSQTSAASVTGTATDAAAVGGAGDLDNGFSSSDDFEAMLRAHEAAARTAAGRCNAGSTAASGSDNEDERWWEQQDDATLGLAAAAASNNGSSRSSSNSTAAIHTGEQQNQVVQQHLLASADQQAKPVALEPSSAAPLAADVASMGTAAASITAVVLAAGATPVANINGFGADADVPQHSSSSVPSSSSSQASSGGAKSDGMGGEMLSLNFSRPTSIGGTLGLPLSPRTAATTGIAEFDWDAAHSSSESAADAAGMLAGQQRLLQLPLQEQIQVHGSATHQEAEQQQQQQHPQQPSCDDTPASTLLDGHELVQQLRQCTKDDVDMQQLERQGQQQQVVQQQDWEAAPQQDTASLQSNASTQEDGQLAASHLLTGQQSDTSAPEAGVVVAASEAGSGCSSCSNHAHQQQCFASHIEQGLHIASAETGLLHLKQQQRAHTPADPSSGGLAEVQQQQQEQGQQCRLSGQLTPGNGSCGTSFQSSHSMGNPNWPAGTDSACMLDVQVASNQLSVQMGMSHAAGPSTMLQCSTGSSCRSLSSLPSTGSSAAGSLVPGFTAELQQLVSDSSSSIAGEFQCDADADATTHQQLVCLALPQATASAPGEPSRPPSAAAAAFSNRAGNCQAPSQELDCSVSGNGWCSSAVDSAAASCSATAATSVADAAAESAHGAGRFVVCHTEPKPMCQAMFVSRQEQSEAFKQPNGEHQQQQQLDPWHISADRAPEAAAAAAPAIMTQQLQFGSYRAGVGYSSVEAAASPATCTACSRSLLAATASTVPVIEAADAAMISSAVDALPASACCSCSIHQAHAATCAGATAGIVKQPGLMGNLTVSSPAAKDSQDCSCSATHAHGVAAAKTAIEQASSEVHKAEDSWGAAGGNCCTTGAQMAGAHMRVGLVGVTASSAAAEPGLRFSTTASPQRVVPPPPASVQQLVPSSACCGSPIAAMQGSFSTLPVRPCLCWSCPCYCQSSSDGFDVAAANAAAASRAQPHTHHAHGLEGPAMKGLGDRQNPWRETELPEPEQLNTAGSISRHQCGTATVGYRVRSGRRRQQQPEYAASCLEQQLSAIESHVQQLQQSSSATAQAEQQLQQQVHQGLQQWQQEQQRQQEEDEQCDIPAAAWKQQQALASAGPRHRSLVHERRDPWESGCGSDYSSQDLQPSHNRRHHHHHSHTRQRSCILHESAVSSYRTPADHVSAGGYPGRWCSSSGPHLSQPAVVPVHCSPFNPGLLAAHAVAVPLLHGASAPRASQPDVLPSRFDYAIGVCGIARYSHASLACSAAQLPSAGQAVHYTLGQGSHSSYTGGVAQLGAANVSSSSSILQAVMQECRWEAQEQASMAAESAAMAAEARVAAAALRCSWKFLEFD